MKSYNTVFIPIFGFALLGALLGGGYFLIRYVIGIFAGLDSHTAALATIASMVALVCAATIAGAIKTRDSLPSQISSEKIETYRRILSVCVDRMPHLDLTSSAAFRRELDEVEQSLALHGSAKVVSTYVRLRNQTRNDDTRNAADSSLFIGLVREMRSDLGRSRAVGLDADLLALLKYRESGV